jgi:mannan endo-1,6-alpha-mannosidase
LDAFMPANQTKQLGNEEQGIWGLAALTAAETGLKDPEGKKWLDLAVNVFNTQVARWDSETCMGGLRWQIFTFNQGYQWKNTLTNAGFYLLSARLAEVTGNKTYFQWAEDSFSWAKGVGLIDEDWRVYDGVDAKTDCDSHEISLLEWSSPHGMYLEGTALMYNMVCYSSLPAASIARSSGRHEPCT